MAKVGLFLCECGPNIADVVDLERIRSEVMQTGQVAGVELHRLLCSEAGQQFVADAIEEHGYDRIVVAACSPKQHEATFAGVLARLGRNPQMLQMVNVREQCAWTVTDKEAATDKAARLVRAAVHRIAAHESLEQREIECNPDVLVVGGGIAGIEVALRTAQPGRRVILVDRAELGGMLRGRDVLFPSMGSAAEMLGTRVEQVRGNPRIEVFENCRVSEVLGFFGSFVAQLETADNEQVERNVGAVVIATGARPAGVEGLDRYGHGRFDGVYTADEFERLAADGPARSAKSVAVVHCAGREKLGYCSKVCCANSLKIARQIKAASPDADVVLFYRDFCLPGKEYDLFHHQTADMGIRFHRVEDVEVEEADGKLLVAGFGSERAVDAAGFDAVVLSTGLEPNPENPALAAMLNVPLESHGFFKEEHVVLNPVGTTTEGVFVVGCAQGPGGVRDSVAGAAAAAGKVLAALVPGRRLQLEVRTSQVSPVFCVGCGVCVAACAYGALTIDESRHISVVNEVLCRGCGNCASACPSGAARHRHFTIAQLGREVTEILK